MKRTNHRDVLKDLALAIDGNFRPGTANSDINVYDFDYTVKYGLLRRLELEIVRLRKALEPEKESRPDFSRLMDKFGH